MTALDHIDLYDPDGYVDAPPWEAFARLRREDPVHWQPGGAGGYWAVMRHPDVLAVSKDDQPDAGAGRGHAPDGGVRDRARRGAGGRPGSDLTSVIVNSELEGHRMDDAEFGSFFVQLVTAGNDTTRTMLSNGTLALLEHPAELARLEGRVFFEELLATFRELEPLGKPRRQRSNLNNALKALPLRLVPA